jgi:hypothetical protein
MFSSTSTSVPRSRAIRTIRNCSAIFGLPSRRTGRSSRSPVMNIGTVPVVFAVTRFPAARSPAAISRVTEDFPRVPFTWIRTGMEKRLRRCSAYSMML